MDTPARSSRYTSVAITLHWVIALSIGGLIAVGWYMGDMEPGAPGQEQLYQMHKSVGITVLLLTVARIVWRWLNPPPPLPAEMPALEKTASHGVHVAFYALMILMPLSGWLYASTAYEFQVPTVLFGVVSWPHIPFVEGLKNETGHGVVEFVHSKLAWVAIGLVVLHVAGAIKHELSDEEGVLKRMIPGLFGKSDAPRAPSRGAGLAFGAAFAVFAIVAGTPLVANALQGETDLSAPEEIAPNWSLDPDTSEIRFSGVHDGNAFSGVFEDWSAAIRFDEDAPGDAEVLVTVDTSSARTGTKLYDDSLKAGEWFDIGDFPTATVSITNITVDDSIAYKRGTGYVAEATLTLKDLSATSPFSFWLDIENGDATLGGTAVFARTALNLGLESDPGADWVSDEIEVDVQVNASRIE